MLISSYTELTQYILIWMVFLSAVTFLYICIYQGPLIQSIVNLTNLLMTNSLIVVAMVFSNTLIFFCKKWVAFAKYQSIRHISR